MEIVGARKYRASTLIESTWRRCLAYKRAELMRVGRYYVWLDRVQGEKDVLFLGDSQKLMAGDKGRAGSINLSEVALRGTHRFQKLYSPSASAPSPALAARQTWASCAGAAPPWE